MTEKRMHRSTGRRHGPEAMAAAERSKNFRASLRQFFRFIGPDKWRILIASICAIFGTMLSLAGPELLRRITDTIVGGLSSSFDLSSVEHLGLLLAGLYGAGFVFNYAQGFLMSGVAQRSLAIQKPGSNSRRSEGFGPSWI